MKRYVLLLSLLFLLILACSLTGGEENIPSSVSEKRCGDKVCDGPENTKNCPQDCADTNSSGGSSIDTDDVSPQDAPTPTKSGDGQPIIGYVYSHKNSARVLPHLWGRGIAASSKNLSLPIQNIRAIICLYR